jgi:hypothetical protein
MVKPGEFSIETIEDALSVHILQMVSQHMRVQVGLLVESLVTVFE